MPGLDSRLRACDGPPCADWMDAQPAAGRNGSGYGRVNLWRRRRRAVDRDAVGYAALIGFTRSLPGETVAAAPEREKCL